MDYTIVIDGMFERMKRLSDDGENGVKLIHSSSPNANEPTMIYEMIYGDYKITICSSREKDGLKRKYTEKTEIHGNDFRKEESMLEKLINLLESK